LLTEYIRTKITNGWSGTAILLFQVIDRLLKLAEAMCS
jgi:hypothetical protein